MTEFQSPVVPSGAARPEQPEQLEQPEQPDDLREQVWTLHLRGRSQRQIALRLTLNRKVVARLLGECEREFAAERRARLKRKLENSIARMRHIQSQAWDDHDADDENGQEHSQKSLHLRLALDAEKEIARLEGLYADDVSDLVAVLFSVERVVGGVVVKRQGSGQEARQVAASGQASEEASDG
jgi:hypothetical protein